MPEQSNPPHTRSPRLGLQLNIRVYLSDDNMILLTTRNISNTGLFIDWETPLDITTGQELSVELAETMGDGSAPQRVRTQVVRIESDGFAVMYLEE